MSDNEIYKYRKEKDPSGQKSSKTKAVKHDYEILRQCQVIRSEEISEYKVGSGRRSWKTDVSVIAV